MSDKQAQCEETLPLPETHIMDGDAGTTKEDTIPTSRTQGQASPSTHAARKGLLAKALLIAPIEDAKTYPRPTKWIITIIISTCAAAAPLGSTILMPALHAVAHDFHSSYTKANLSIAFYSLAVAFTPLWWSSLSEARGRRLVYVVSFLMLIVFNIIAAVSVSMDMFIVMRCLAGAASASVQSVGAGTVADLWAVKERGRAMGVFFLGPMLGPVVAPIIGGALTSPLGWRSTQWALVVYSALLWIIILLYLPETKSQTPRRDRASSGGGIRTRVVGLCRIVVQPLQVVPLLRHTPIFLVVYYGSITFASYYFLNLSIQATFSEPPYDFSPVEVGLLYLPSSLGYLLAGLFGGKWADQVMRQRAAKAGRYSDDDPNPQFRPQDRIGLNAWLAGFMFPLALLWYGWTARFHVFWLVPSIANFFYGVGQMLVFNVTTVMLTEFVPKRTSSGVAVNNLLRNTLACIAAVVAQPLIDAIGNGWLFSIVCFICLPSSLVFLVLQHKAETWHEKMAIELSAA